MAISNAAGPPPVALVPIHKAPLPIDTAVPTLETFFSISFLLL
jgi:hypothetical protein